MSTVDEWAEQFGNIDPFKKQDRVEGFNMEYDLAYTCKIDSAQLTQSSRGDKQIKLNLAVLASDDPEAEEIGRRIEYMDLPKQASDHNLSPELVTRLTRRRFLDVLRILSAAQPHEFALYAGVDEADGRKVYKDFTGKTMEKEDFARREASIHADCKLWVDNAHDKIGQPVEELQGAVLYVQKVQNKKSEKYPFTNWYAVAPAKVKLFKADSETPF